MTLYLVKMSKEYQTTKKWPLDWNDDVYGKFSKAVLP